MPAEISPNFSPRRAVVTPRARKAPGGAALPIEQLIRPLLEKHARGFVVLNGVPGIGKTTALRHLATALPRDARVKFLDNPKLDHALASDPDELVVIATDERISSVKFAAQYDLAEWSEDDCMEYLAARHRNRCGSVLARLHADADRGEIGGSPELWRMILDEMADDESVTSASQALRRCLAELSLDNATERAIAEIVFHQVMKSDVEFSAQTIDLRANEKFQLLRHQPVQMIHAAKHLVRALAELRGADLLVKPLPRALIREVASAVKQSSALAQKLTDLIRSADRRTDAMAASILLASDPNWRPWIGRPLWFNEAHLANARWAGLDLQDCELSEADLNGADLRGSNLNRVEAGRAKFQGANLRAASLDELHAPSANFSGTDLTGARGEAPIFSGANFQGACLQDSAFPRGEFLGANFEKANCARADLTRAVLFAVNVADADFIGANLRGAKLHQAKMHQATWTGASFMSASLSECDLEGIELPNADFRDAQLMGCLFTGTRMQRGRFRGADLRNTGLAEIDWAEADLRDADLRGATFHMGSTRSGLVGSVTPCEGSRTGFYTDDFAEQDFKAPEEIRKANLCGADLRGAKIDNVDFYLVDLRGAKYSQDQAEHFRKCGAIL